MPLLRALICSLRPVTNLLPAAVLCALALAGLPSSAEELSPRILTSLVRATEGDARPATGRFEVRGRHTWVLSPGQNAQAGVLLRAEKGNGSHEPVYYALLDAAGKQIARGQCALGHDATAFIPAGRACLLRVESGTNLVSVQIEGAAYGLLASEEHPAHLRATDARLHFLVPRGTRAFTLHTRAEAGADSTPVRVLNPSGKRVAAQVVQTGTESALRVSVDAADSGAVWSLEIEADRGRQEVALWLGSGVPPYLAADAGALALPFIHYVASGALYMGNRNRPALLEATMNVTPQPDRLVFAAMTRAGSNRAIWATRPVPFANGQVRVMLPDSIAAGAYDLRTTLLENQTRIAATHAQRITIAQGFAHLGSPRPILDARLAAAPGAGSAPAVHARFAIDETSLRQMVLRTALTRAGEERPAYQEDLGQPAGRELDLPLPKGAPDGLYRLAATLSDAAGKTLAASSHSIYLNGGRLFLEKPPRPPARKTQLLRSQRRRGYVLFAREYHDAFPANYEPPRADIGRPLTVWATPGEIEPATFGVYTLKPLREARVTAGLLYRAGGGGTIAANRIEVRSVRFWPQRDAADGSRFRLLPELLEPARPADLPTGRISQYWLTLRVPESTPAGDYRGLVTFAARDARPSELKVLVKVLPFTLAKPAGRTWGLTADSRRWLHYSDAEIEQEMREIHAHGVDSLVLDPLAYGTIEYDRGKVRVEFSPLSRIIALYRKAGLRGPVVLDFRELGETLSRVRGKDAPVFDAEWRRLTSVVLSELAMRAASEGWPETICRTAGGPDGQTPGGAQRVRDELAALKKAGLGAIVAAGEPDASAKNPSDLGHRLFDADAALADAGAGTALLQQCKAAGKPFWWQTDGLPEGSVLASRYLAGIAFWRSGAAAAWVGPLQRVHGSAYNDFDGEGADALKDECLAYPAPGRNALLPTLQWEGIREGVDDARYLYTFEQMLARARHSGNARAMAYADQVEREAADALKRIPWGAAARLSPEDARAMRVRLAKYMGTLLNKVQAPAGGSAAAPAAHPRSAKATRSYRSARPHTTAKKPPRRHTASRRSDGGSGATVRRTRSAGGDRQRTTRSRRSREETRARRGARTTRRQATEKRSVRHKSRTRDTEHRARRARGRDEAPRAKRRPAGKARKSTRASKRRRR